MAKKTIYPIGDSHAWHGWLHVKNAMPYTVGPMTMHSFGLNKPILTNLIPLDAIVCFCWGEIDCRCHVAKYPPYDHTIKVLVENYIEAIGVNVVGRDPENVWVYNVVPPPRRRDAKAENPSFPFLGGDQDRLHYVTLMNDLLRKSPYTFVDLYKQYSDEEGFLDMSKSDGHVHIAELGPLERFVNDHT